MSRDETVGYAFIAALIVFFVTLVAPARSQDCVFGAYGCGHMENHDQYKELHREPTPSQREQGIKGMHCCREGDCRPTKAVKGDPLNPGLDEDSWYAWDGRIWRRVPKEAELPHDMLGDGRCHVCAPPDAAIIYCFISCEPKG